MSFGQAVLKRQEVSTPSVEDLNNLYGNLSTQEILRIAIEELFPNKIALVSSFGAESSTLLHLVASVAPDTPVVFIDTGKHFAQTYSYKRKLEKQLGLTNILDIKPDEADLALKDPEGELWRANSDACCDIRKVQPLRSALEGFDVWISGRKQFHGGDRLYLPVFEQSKTHIKINPLAKWQADDITSYVKDNNLPPHPLVEQGFPSIGCWPCTHPASSQDDVRAGRWRGQKKTECGIHL